jgi:hypothetical protein
MSVWLINDDVCIFHILRIIICHILPWASNISISSILNEFERKKR